MDDEPPDVEYVDCFEFTGEEVIERATSKTSIGKSALLMNLILQDIEHGHGLLLIDPHTDMIADILRRLPA